MTNAPKVSLVLASAGLTPAQDARWRNLLPEFVAELPDPQQVEVVITDRYQQVAGQYAVQAVNKMNEQMTAEQYSAGKIDGALAPARTVELPDRVVVVIAAQLLGLPADMSRHTVLHEAQHVRIIQHGDQAHAVHRRVSFDLPRDEITWELLWLAEGAIDEFRAERGIQQRGLAAAEHGVTVDDFAGIVTAFRRTRTTYRSDRELMRAYHGATLSLERLATYLAYGAALIVTGKAAAEQWARVPAMGRMLDVLEGVPGADVTLPDHDLVDVATRLAMRLRQMLREQGFDLYYTRDGAKYLEVL